MDRSLGREKCKVGGKFLVLKNFRVPYSYPLCTKNTELIYVHYVHITVYLD